MGKVPMYRVVVAAAIAIMLCSATALYADSEIKFSGELRSRTELDRRSFNPSRSLHEYTDLRTRLALEAIHDGDTHIFIQLQDSRRVGMGGASGSLSSTDNVDIHQAYLRIDNLFGGYWGFQAGRFEVNLGNQRVFGSVGWNNVGRSWEGMNAWYATDDVKIAAYWLKRAERLNPIENDDFDIYGVNAVIKDTGLELLAFYEFDADEHFGYMTPPTDINNLDRFDVGFYLKRAIENAHLIANGVYQFGNQAHVQVDTVTEYDISAFLVTAEMGYTFESDFEPMVAVGIDYASGDDDPADDSFGTYDNLYYTAHKFRGFMDYFVVSKSEGLVDIIAKSAFLPAAGWNVAGVFHYFRSAKEYTDYTAEEDTKTNAIGVEIDLTATTTRIAGVRIDGGFSVFLPDESFAGKDADPGIWGFISLAGSFGGE